MTKSISMSFSIPIELSIAMEECMETEKITRSELIKKALNLYFETRGNGLTNSNLIKDLYKTVNEIRNLMDKQ